MEVNCIRPVKTKSTELVNDDVPNKEMLVIDNEGNKLGVLSKKEALSKAAQYDLDLVVVAPDANPMVAKLMDYSKYRFDQQKKMREMKKNQKTFQLKELRLSPTIDKHDFDTKLKHAIRFLQDGDKVKISIRFKGRMITHKDVGAVVMKNFVESLVEYSTIESKTKMEGNSMITILAPSKDIKKEGE
ncbi:translation initiation factor IF-3 [Acholeplasma sp. OttesenSCG-928-E16]|nr:translation initiation factor IF-3 [Acholeplasma sp. OttesenSCG-928-E16]